MPRRQRRSKQVETLRHDEAKRTNIPTAEYSSAMEDDDRSPIEVAYARRNRDLDPQLVWRGKDEQDLSDLVVQAPPLYIQEKVHPKVLIDDLRRRSEQAVKDDAIAENGYQTDLFADFKRAAGGRRPHGFLRARRQLVEPHDPRRQPAGDGLTRRARGGCAARCSASTSTRRTASSSTRTSSGRRRAATSRMAMRHTSRANPSR